MRELARQNAERNNQRVAAVNVASPVNETRDSNSAVNPAMGNVGPRLRTVGRPQNDIDTNPLGLRGSGAADVLDGNGHHSHSEHVETIPSTRREIK
jgi:hypothetical protein